MELALLTLIAVMALCTVILVAHLCWPRKTEAAPVLDEQVEAAIRGAFEDCGLPLESYAPDFDLVRSGKYHEVLHHASARLGRPVRTVADLHALLT